MRYLGNKTKLVSPLLQEVLRQSPNPRYILDAFGGSGAAGLALKSLGARIESNDFLYFAACLQASRVCTNKVPAFLELRKALSCGPLEFLNSDSSALLAYAKSRTTTQSRFSETAGRTYFTDANAERIDACRGAIEDFLNHGICSPEEHAFLLGCLVSAASHIANTTGTFGAFLKVWDKRALKPLRLEVPDLIDNGELNQSFNLDVTEFIRGRAADVAYFDPPYNSRQYLSNYHVLEAIACWATPASESVSGVYRDSSKKSAFCSKRTAEQALKDLLIECVAGAVVFSYSSEGILSTEVIERALKRWGRAETYNLTRIEHARYQNTKARKSGVTELLFSIKRGA